MAIVVCGVGYIGAALAATLLTGGQEVVGFDNGFSTDRRAIDALIRHGGFRFVEGDVARADDVERAFGADEIDTVYHLAAQSSATADVPAEYTEVTNLRGPRVVLEACDRRGVDTLVFGSSLRVLGQPLPESFDESSPYGAQRDLSHLSKIYAEKLLEMQAARAAVRAVAARLPIVYGLAPVMKRQPAFMTVPNRFAYQAVRGEKLTIAPGQGMLNLLHVDDAVSALLACGRMDGSGYDAANVLGEWCSLGRLADLVRDEGARRGLDVQVDATDEPAPPTPRGESCLKHFTPTRDLRGGIRELIDYFLV